MNHHGELSEVFRPHLQWHRARLDFLAAFVLALIRVRSVNLAQIAGAHRLQLPPLPEVPGRVQLRPGNHRTADPAALTAKPGAKAGLEPGSYRVEVGPPQHQPRG